MLSMWVAFLLYFNILLLIIGVICGYKSRTCKTLLYIFKKPYLPAAQRRRLIFFFNGNYCSPIVAIGILCSTTEKRFCFPRDRLYASIAYIHLGTPRLHVVITIFVSLCILLNHNVYTKYVRTWFTNLSVGTNTFGVYLRISVIT